MPVDGTNRPAAWTSVAIATARAPVEWLSPSGQDVSLSLQQPRRRVVESLSNLSNTNQGFRATNAMDLAVNDYVLAHKAWHEFKLRGVDLDHLRGNHLMVVSDATTLIGRALPHLFGKLLGDHGPNAPNDLVRSGMGPAMPSNLHVFSYLSGLDGGGVFEDRGRAGGSAGKDVGRGDPDASPEPSGTGDGNPPMGANQMDSIERLAAAVGNLDTQLRIEGKGAIRGVVVGGGDIYDTLLVLRALRHVLPYAVFITTELDARLWEPEAWAYTHNLVVVSGYGLSLGTSFQAQSLPFRDSRQTALCAATLATLDRQEFEKWSGFVPGSDSPSPYPVPSRVFEIGRSGPLDLTPSTPNTNQLSIHPATSAGLRRPDLMLYLATAAITGLLLLVGILTVSPLQWLFRAKYEHLSQPLWFCEDDLGGSRGIWHLRNLIAGLDLRGKPKNEGGDVLANALEMKPTTRSGEENDTGLGDLHCFRGADISDSDGLALYANKGRIQRVLRRQIGWSRGGRPVSKSAPDVASYLNELLEHLVGDQCWGKAGEKGDARIFSGEVWSKLEGFIGPKESSLAAESLRDHHRTPLCEWNRRLFARQLITEIFSDYLAPWSPDPAGHGEALKIADELNRALKGAKHDSRTVANGAEFKHLMGQRRQLDTFLSEMASNVPETTGRILHAAQQSRAVGRMLYELRLRRLWLFRIVLILAFVTIVVAACFAVYYRTDSNGDFLSGTSPAPTVFGLCIAVSFSVIFYIQSYSSFRQTTLDISREYRFKLKELDGDRDGTDRGDSSNVDRSTGLMNRIASMWSACRLPSVPEHQSPVDADRLWREYQIKSQPWHRGVRVAILSIVYLAAMMIFFVVSGCGVYDIVPLRAEWRSAHMAASLFAGICFVIVACRVLDSALLCGWFIRCLTQGPTLYPRDAEKAVRDRHGLIDPQIIANYIDVKLIHRITGRIGGLLYFPAVVLSIILMSYNTLTYTWPWPASWLAIVCGHLAIAGAGVIALQRAAKASRDKSVEELERHLSHRRLQQADSKAALKEAELDRAEGLVLEVRNLSDGAFSGLFNNPVLGASLLPVASVLLMNLLRRSILP